MKKIVKSTSTEQTQRLAVEFSDTLQGNEIIAMFGDLGAGKTTFTKALCGALGVKEDVTSPTFSLLNIYNGRFKVYHFDMYRIKTSEDLESIGYFDCIDNDGVVVIEWSENVEEFIDPDIKINIKYAKKEGERLISFSRRAEQ